MKSTICISITDALNITRNAIKHYLNSIADLHVVFDTRTGHELLDKLKLQKPHVCILEVMLPDISGLEILSKVKKALGNEGKILMLSSYNSPITISKFLKNGASGYVLKQENPDNLRKAILQVHDGAMYLPQPLLRTLISTQQISMEKMWAMSISKKEYLFLSYCNSELTYKEIASKMFISPRTLEGYRDSLFRKLNVKSRIGLALYAARSGISLIN